MIIGLDGNEANVEFRVGVSWCVFHMLTEFKKRATKEMQIRVFLRNNPRPDLPSESDFFVYSVIKGPFLWSQIFLPLALYFHNRDLSVFFSPAHYAPRFCPVKSVVILHDLSFFYYPSEFLKKDLYQLVEWTKYSVQHAHTVIAVSEETRRDATHLYNLPEKKIVAIHNGIEIQTIHISESTSYLVQKPYFLYIGTLQPRKNIVGLIHSFDRYHANHPDYHLYIVGKKGWLYDEFYELVQKRKLSESVHFTGYISEEERHFLLKNAQAFIAPEFYGGFGLTLPEAMAEKVPVIASRTGAFQEVGGDACFYINPFDHDSLVYAMDKITSDTLLRNELIQKGLAQCKKFTWGSAVDKYVQVLRSCT